MSINTPFTVKVDKNNQLIITEKKNIIPKNANAGVVEFKKLPIKDQLKFSKILPVLHKISLKNKFINEKLGFKVLYVPK